MERETEMERKREKEKVSLEVCRAELMACLILDVWEEAVVALGEDTLMRELVTCC